MLSTRSYYVPTIKNAPMISKSSSRDERNFVKKGVNWALRQMGKRNSHLRILIF
ncbi:DNA alkylation repair protein [Reticulibacter mediterranei]|uniref:DNA alkylation repair protein n=1 Tax=Reticulibacter mediterranei TaxID=2778369 RepID=UPI001C689017|nr:DNA alkylation repair protein [Reticulibacter mediterranei]